MNPDGRQSVIRKIAITVIVGGLSFPLTNLLFQSQAEQLAMSAAVGSIILIVQLLIEVEHRLATVESHQEEHAKLTREVVEDRFSKINEATKLYGKVETLELKEDSITNLVQNAARVGPEASPLVLRLVQREIDNMASFLRDLSSHHVTYEGEDRNWLLSLSSCARRTIDAVSLPAVDAGGEIYLGGFWGSDLGQRYLNLQHEAVRRGVHVRRVFVIERPELVDEPDVLRTCHEQAALGIEVRLLYGPSLPKQMFSYDFILFDDQISYEVTPSPRTEDSVNPLILHTRLVLEPERLRDRQDTYAQLWESAKSLTMIQESASPWS